MQREALNMIYTHVCAETDKTDRHPTVFQNKIAPKATFPVLHYCDMRMYHHCRCYMHVPVLSYCRGATVNRANNTIFTVLFSVLRFWSPCVLRYHAARIIRTAAYSTNILQAHFFATTPPPNTAKKSLAHVPNFLCRFPYTGRTTKKHKNQNNASLTAFFCPSALDRTTLHRLFIRSRMSRRRPSGLWRALSLPPPYSSPLPRLQQNFAFNDQNRFHYFSTFDHHQQALHNHTAKKTKQQPKNQKNMTRHKQ